MRPPRATLKKRRSEAPDLLGNESGTYLKKWKDRIPVALLYPNTYAVGVSNLGFQLVYSLLNQFDHLVCERFFLSKDPAVTLRSFESDRLLTDFPLLFYSISFEHDYVNLAKLLLKGGVTLFAEDRGDTLISNENPMVVGGGVATFMNPEPLAPFSDLFLLGEAEGMVQDFVMLFTEKMESVSRSELLYLTQKTVSAAYVPSFHKAVYSVKTGRLCDSVPLRGKDSSIKKHTIQSVEKAAHSQLLSPDAEFSNLYVTELGRGCSKGCRFCAAGFIYRPPRLWDADAVVRGIEERSSDVKRIGLLGMEMAQKVELETLSSYLLDSGCSLSFSSLRADRISGQLLKLLRNSGLKSVAIAPDGASERLRRVINKNLTEDDILLAVERLAKAGLYKLKLYLMIGLPTENMDDLQEMIDLIKKIKKRMLPFGRKRGRLCEISLSVNCFAPKPWTPFQFHPFGGIECDSGCEINVLQTIRSLKFKIAFLKKGIRNEANVRFNHDKPENVLFQAVLAKGDRRLAKVLATMARDHIPWKQAMKKHDLSPEFYAIYQHAKDDYFPWNIVDHGINQKYLWTEYQKSFLAQTTVACDTKVCKRCGVCGE